MSKLERKNHKVFGINATETKVGQFGSANATTKITTKDVEKIQALDAWEQGWEAGAVGNNRYPTQQERTGVDYEHSYQIGYMLQEGVPEWNKDTTFNKGSIVKAYNGTTLQIYVSLVDENLNNPVTDITKWKSGLANSDLSNLTPTGEKHFLNKSQVTNCILEAPNGVATYSGNVVTVPTGVKALVNSGLTNADGTIKNIEVTTLEEQTITVSATGIVYLGSDGTLNTTNGAPLVSVVYGTSSISAIYPYSPVELLKKSDKTNITKWSFPSDKVVNLTLGATETPYEAPADGWVSLNCQTMINAPNAEKRYVFLQVNSKTRDNAYRDIKWFENAHTNLEYGGIIPITKGDIFLVGYSEGSTLSVESWEFGLCFIYAVGSEPSN